MAHAYRIASVILLGLILSGCVIDRIPTPAGMATRIAFATNIGTLSAKYESDDGKTKVEAAIDETNVDQGTASANAVTATAKALQAMAEKTTP